MYTFDCFSCVSNFKALQKNTCVSGYDFVDLCRLLRKAIRNDRLTVDLTTLVSNNGDNTLYFKFIKACGYDVQKFIISYLYNLQPCTLVKKQAERKTSSGHIVVVLDLGYKINLYIAIDKSEKIAVSFHYDTFGSEKMSGSIKQKLFRDERSPYSYILMNEVQSPSSVFFNVAISRGFCTLYRRLQGEYVDQDLVIVSTSDLFDSIKELMTESVVNLVGTYQISSDVKLHGVIDTISRADNLSLFSLTSYGETNYSKVSMLIDIFSMTTSQQERRSILTLLETVLNEMLFIEDKSLLYNVFSEKYKNTLNNISDQNLALELVMSNLK